MSVVTLDTNSATILRFGTFQVDLRAGELHKQGKRVKLQEQPFQVLAVLVQRSGDVVTREELRSQIWSADTFVDFDNSLNAAINKLREALGDSADNPRFIETLPRRGYRLIVPVAVGLPSSGQSVEMVPSNRLTATVSTTHSEPTPPARFLLRWIAIGAAGTLIVAVLAYLLTRPLPPPRVTSTRQITRDNIRKEVSSRTDPVSMFKRE